MNISLAITTTPASVAAIVITAFTVRLVATERAASTRSMSSPTAAAAKAMPATV